MLLFLLACQTSDPKDSLAGTDSRQDSVADSREDSSGDSQPVAELHGKAPENPVDLPDFQVTSMDGTSRTRVDLLGHATVMWFYPAANTAG
ncbi:MAG TPA: hypothetical protein PKY30_04080 [Myxococcota bacterium]|nr:hypothetical protein [Myxococcota bacterium]HNH46187.1 hypothetical protein [Myxococcota bacterium]